jgi:hypothetical protein
MAVSDLDSQIQARIQAFADEVSALVRTSTVQAVAEALGNGAPARRGIGRPRGAVGTARIGPASRRKGAKRDPKELDALTTTLGDFIKKNPGKRIEEIGSALGISTKELALPAKKLIAAKVVSTRGTRRATKYFAR